MVHISFLLSLIGLGHFLRAADAAMDVSPRSDYQSLVTEEDWLAKKREMYVYHSILLQPSSNSSDHRPNNLIVKDDGNDNEDYDKARKEFTRKLQQQQSTYVRSGTTRYKKRTASRLPGKKGIGFLLRDEGEEGSWVNNMPKVVALNVYWNYCWGSERRPEQPTGIEFVPMVWGAWSYQKLSDDVLNNIRPTYQAGHTRLLLGFNEPDSFKQAHMSVDKAVTKWAFMELAGMPLASPAPVFPMGEWLTSFVQQVSQQNMRLDYIAVHWYGWPNAAQFKTQMTDIYNYYGQKPLLITEFAPADWDAKTKQDNRFTRSEVLDFMKNVMPWLEETSWIYGYAWFPFWADFGPGFSSALFETDGRITALGSYYTSVRSDNPQGDQSIKVWT